MSTSTSTSTRIQAAVREFFGNRRICYATVGTDRNSSNFYGDTLISKMNRAYVIACIETLHDHLASVEDGPNDPEQQAIADVLNDLQFDKPE